VVTLLRSKRWWVWSNAIGCTVVSLIAAAITHNENWPLNIVICMPVGALIGWLGWHGAHRGGQS
jgi:hypothetical protein